MMAEALLSDANDRWTPAAIFEPLHAEFRFTIDVAASARNAKCARFFDAAQNGLVQSWAGERVWCNPPYSDLRPWVEKALRETREGGCPLAVLLLPATRTEQAWWQDLIEPVRDRVGSGVRTVFLRGRPRFGNEAHPKGQPGAKFGVVVVVFEKGGG